MPHKDTIRSLAFWFGRGVHPWRSRTLQAGAACLLLFAVQTHAQSPSLQATSSAAPRHLQVLYTSGVLTVHAENSSLNGIIREITRLTGMSVTGGVLDERVYGNYGPADTGAVLATLLAGTGSNMMLQESTADRPLTLVLTPRQGGATPPSPGSVAPDADEPPTQRNQADLPPQQIRPTPIPGTLPTSASPQGATPGSSIPPTSTTSDDTAAATATSNTTDQQSPNGVKTPQQIYDQLMKLKQQRATTPQ